jgi:hypothetical protein
VADARVQVLYGYTASGALRPQPNWPDELALFGWRLIGGNNRELARGAQSFATYALVREAVQVLSGVLAELDWAVRNDARTGQWYWHAENAGAAVMVGGRSYERERDCRDCISHVRVALVDAVVTPGVTVLRPKGASGGGRPITLRANVPLDAS